MKDTINNSRQPEQQRQRNLAQALIGFALYIFLVPTMLFIAGGSAHWPMAWVYTFLLLASTLSSRLIVWFKNPDLLRERAQFTSAPNAKAEDRLLVSIVGLFGPMLMSLVAGLDYRFGWSPAVSPTAQAVGALIVAAAYSLAVWAMVVNRYFSAVVRIQEDRGQTVIRSGPYALIRHPAYAGSMWAALAFPVMMGTLWALLPGLGLIIALILRTRLEDEMLLADLPGYADYAARTRYRLLPGVW